MAIFNMLQYGSGGGEGRYQQKTATPSLAQQTILPDAGYDALSQVGLSPITTELLHALDNNFKSDNIKSGVSIFDIVGSFDGDSTYCQIEQGTAYPSQRTFTLQFTHRPRLFIGGRSPLFGTGGTNIEYYMWDGIAEQAIHLAAGGKIDISATMGWDKDGSGMNIFTVDSYYSSGSYTYYWLAVYNSDNVPGLYQSKTVNPSQSAQRISPDNGYDAIAYVDINPVTTAMLQGWDSDFVAGNIRTGKNILGVQGTYSGGMPENPVAGNTPFAMEINFTNVTNTTYSRMSNNGITIPKTGTYRFRWAAYRTNTSGTWGTRLYRIPAGSSTAEQIAGSEITTWTNNYYQKSQMDVACNAGDVILLYGRSRSTSYTIYPIQLIASIDWNM